MSSSSSLRSLVSVIRCVGSLVEASASTSGSNIFRPATLGFSRPSFARSISTSAPRCYGLEEFFDLRPEEEGKPLPVGRAWLAEELRRKSFDDLHKLWYVCSKEKNVLLTLRAMHEANGRRAPDHEKARLVSVKKTMARIKTVLSEREKAEPDARKAAALRSVINAL